jgi:hypothetical protein
MLFHRGPCKKFRGTCRRLELFAKITDHSFFVDAHVCKENKNSHFDEHFDFKNLKRKVANFRLEKQDTSYRTI